MSSELCCKYFKFGHCKFGQTCRNQHVKQVCETIECDIGSCLYRHPKHCKYYMQYQRCTFGEYCSFKHVNSGSNVYFGKEIHESKDEKCKTTFKSKVS